MNQKLFIVAILFFFGLITSLQAQKTKIYGKVENANSYSFKLIKHTDFLSMLEEKVAEDLIDDHGNFSLEIELKSTHLFLLNIGFQKAEIYLEPGKSYELKVKYDPLKEQITFVNNAYLDFEILNSTKNELNHQIRVFDGEVNQFLIENFNKIYKYRNQKIINQFSEKIKAEFNDVMPFLKTYIDYRLASIEENSGLLNRKSISTAYFQNPEVFFENDEAMRFFNQAFDQYLLKPNLFFERSKLMQEIHTEANLESIYAMLDNDPLLHDQALKELALLKSLQELFYLPSANEKALLSLMNKVGQNALGPEIAKMANHLTKRLSYLRIGAQFPQEYEIELEDSSSNGKDLFLHFFSLPCADCVREMDSISTLYQVYKKEVKFVSIALNSEKSALEKLLKAKQYSWEIVLSSESFKLAEIYDIKSLPSYFLINSDDEIIINPALKPWKGFSHAFESQYKH